MRVHTFLVFLLIPFCLGQEESKPERAARAPQGHIQYDDSNGYRVSWKLFAPYTQWKSELQNSQTSESKSDQSEAVLETKAEKSQETPAPVLEKEQEEQQQKQQIEPAVEYQPYSMVPTHIKQLIFKMYEPQGPYVDPKVYIYHTPIPASIEEEAFVKPEPKKNAERRQESVPASEETVEPVQKYSYSEQETASQQQVQQRSTATTQELSAEEEEPKLVSGFQNPILKKRAQFGYSKYPLKEIGHIEYKKEDSDLKSAQYGYIPPQEPKAALVTESVQPAVEPHQAHQDKLMPTLIQQLLNLQAQIPYYVIANRINYKPKKMFIPKPISEDEKGIYTYRSKVYFMRDEEEDQENNSEGKFSKETPKH